MNEASLPVELIALTLILALVGGLAPIFSNIKENHDTMRRITGIASGILLASALLVVIPEGFELATGGHDEHGHEEKDEHGHEDHDEHDHEDSKKGEIHSATTIRGLSSAKELQTCSAQWIRRLSDGPRDATPSPAGATPGPFWEG